MEKEKKSGKSKVTRSYKCDPDLYERAIAKCHQESINTNKRITLSGLIEEFIKNYVEFGYKK